MGENNTNRNGLTTEFIARWSGVRASELSTAQSFVRELCELLSVPVPHPTPERRTTCSSGPSPSATATAQPAPGALTATARGHFVLEAKKLKAGSHTKGFDDGLLRARARGKATPVPCPQLKAARRFCWWWTWAPSSRCMPSSAAVAPPTPPSPTRAATASPWPIWLNPRCWTRLHAIWTDPTALTPPAPAPAQSPAKCAAACRAWPSRWSKAATAPHVAAFFTRCLFSMFAEDVELLPKGSFWHKTCCKPGYPGASNPPPPRRASTCCATCGPTMDRGGFSTALATKVLHFNGKLFKEPSSTAIACY
jgi:hypothetical protein